MTIMYEKVQAIYAEFQQEYRAIAKYIVTGIIRLAVIEHKRQGKLGPASQNVVGKPIEPSDDRKEFCISVNIYSALPSGLTLPEEYKGVRLYTTNIARKIRAC